MLRHCSRNRAEPEGGSTGACPGKVYGQGAASVPQHRIQIYAEAEPAGVKHLFSAKGFSKWREKWGQERGEGHDNLVSRQTFDLYSVYRGVYHRPHPPSAPPRTPNGRCYRPRDAVPGPSRCRQATRRSPCAIYPPIKRPVLWTTTSRATCPPFVKQRAPLWRE